VPIYKKGDKTDYTNYRGKSMLPTTYKIFSSALLSSLTPHIDEITEDYQCRFCHKRSTTDQMFCIHQILEKKWECNGTVNQLFIDFKTAYDSVRSKVLHNILTEFGIPMKLLGLIYRFQDCL
jgi:hypothetical protein